MVRKEDANSVGVQEVLLPKVHDVFVIDIKKEQLKTLQRRSVTVTLLLGKLTKKGHQVRC